MAPSKRQTSGRSPLVNPQSQITSFFSKTNSPSPSPSPSPTLSKLNPNKSNPNPNPISDRSPSRSPTTPSPLQSKPKKPRLVIGQTPSPPTPADTKSYGEEVVGKSLRVYWPLDKAWYEGCVKSFDKKCNKHWVQYEDGEEELLDLGKEKIEWVHESVNGFKRLRRGCSLAFKKVVIEDDEEMGNLGEESSDNKSDSSDGDWDKKAEEPLSEDEEVDLVDEQEEKVGGGRKRKADGGGKKSKSSGDSVTGGFKVSVMEPVKNFESK